MAVTFQGTYTKDHGTAAAAGTVSITPLGGSATVETLDSTGSYTVALTPTGAQEEFAVVETITGAAVKSYTVKALDGVTVTTGRDVNIVGIDSALPTPASIGAVKLFTGAGVPGTGFATPGAADGDLAVNSAGVKASTDCIYQHQAGAWVALV